MGKPGQPPGCRVSSGLLHCRTLAPLFSSPATSSPHTVPTPGTELSLGVLLLPQNQRHSSWQGPALPVPVSHGCSRDSSSVPTRHREPPAHLAGGIARCHVLLAARPPRCQLLVRHLEGANRLLQGLPHLGAGAVLRRGGAAPSTRCPQPVLAGPQQGHGTTPGRPPLPSCCRCPRTPAGGSGASCRVGETWARSAPRGAARCCRGRAARPGRSQQQGAQPTVPQPEPPGRPACRAWWSQRGASGHSGRASQPVLHLAVLLEQGTA